MPRDSVVARDGSITVDCYLAGDPAIVETDALVAFGYRIEFDENLVTVAGYEYAAGWSDACSALPAMEMWI